MSTTSQRDRPLSSDTEQIDPSRLETVEQRLGPYNVSYTFFFDGEQWTMGSVKFEKTRAGLVTNNAMQRFSGAFSSRGPVFRPSGPSGFETIEEAREVIL